MKAKSSGLVVLKRDEDNTAIYIPVPKWRVYTNLVVVDGKTLPPKTWIRSGPK